ncbi:MAG: hypothetical protein JKY67_19810 [Pseudomonadales bacterium]|nr:hypothetical protein [Pseudomonadales bacterium]
MVLIERRSKTGENEWISAVLVLSTCFLVPFLEGDIKWIVLAVVTVPIVCFEAFRKKVREPLVGIWDETVFFYRRGKLTATFPLAEISEMRVESKGIKGEVIILHLVGDEEFRFDLSICRRPLRKAVIQCLHKHLTLKPGLSLQA